MSIDRRYKHVRHYIDIRGHRIAVNAASGAQANWYRANYAQLSNTELAIRAAETYSDDCMRARDSACNARSFAAIARRAQFHIVA